MSKAREAGEAIQSFMQQAEDDILVSAFADIQKWKHSGLIPGGMLLDLRQKLSPLLNELTINPLKALEDAICYELADRYCRLRKLKNPVKSAAIDPLRS